MSDLRETYELLGEAVLEEIVVRAGLDQGQTPAADALPIALNFVVHADAEAGCLVIRGERVNQAPLELRVDLG